MPLAAKPMLQQQKCLETLAEQKKRQNKATQSTKLRGDDVAKDAAKVVGVERCSVDAENRRLNKALNSTLAVFERTACQHVAAQQRPCKTRTTTTENLPSKRQNANVGITDKCMLNAAPRNTTNRASNIVDVTSLAEHTNTHVALPAVLSTQTQVSDARSTTILVGNASTNSADLNVLGNMLPQQAALPRLKANEMLQPKQSVVTAISAEKLEKIPTTKMKAAALKTTTTTTQSIINTDMIVGAPATLPSLKHDQQNTEKTIDFNSRRRRGRLRSTRFDASERVHNVVSDSGITGVVCRTLLWLATYLERVACSRANAGYGKSDPLLYVLSLLLSLIVVNVNRVASLVNEFNKNEVNKIQLVKPNNNTNTNTTTTITTNKNNSNSSIKNNLKLITKSTQASSVAKAGQLAAEVGVIEMAMPTTDSASELAPLADVKPKRAFKVKRNGKLCPQNAASIPNSAAEVATKHSSISETTTPNAALVRDASNCSAPPQQAGTTTYNRQTFSAISWRSSQMQLLFYAFILCTSILLPCGNNLVYAAKPKSATQLQQQKQLQQQQLLLEQQQQQQQHHQQHEHHQQGHQAHQPAAGPNGGVGVPGYPGLGIPVAAGGPGADLTPPTYQVVSSQTSNEETEFVFPAEQSDEQLFDQEEQNLNVVEIEEEHNKPYELDSNETIHPNVTKAPLFPKDLFTKEQLENGAVIFHIIGVIYMFVALAIVCDEFFVPSLDVIIEKLDITDDVAGATFMAAGGSAPELFTSVIGVFISFDDVGIGTIVGSAVFNILFVIGMCALFSKSILSLTWWPLFRDCSFYSLSLLVLIYFFRDNFIFWWEALILFSIYIAYVAFMKWNVQVERFVKRLVTKNKVTRVRSTDQLMPAGNAANSSETSMATQPGGSVTSRAASETRSGPPGSSSGAGATGNSSGGTAGSTHTGAKFRHGLLQLMIHTIDPLHDDDVPGKVDEKATQLHAIASLKVLLDATKPQRGGATTSAANHVKINLKETTLADRPNGNIDTTLDSANEIEDEPEPLSMAWPDTARKRLTYILVAPLLIPMWLTLPDTRTPRGKKFYPVTFIGSILWIAAFSYLMVWWANVAGDTARIPPEVMGLTFLAAGTSIPDLITSVIVARKGFGDMAVSSSVGSNIFDVTVGLPIPWLIYGIIYDAPVEVNSVGMVCSITILFMMLLFVVLSIACFRWKMNRGLGFTMFLLYFVFVAVSLMFEYDTLQCPV